jgi:hypothetical protein
VHAKSVCPVKVDIEMTTPRLAHSGGLSSSLDTVEAIEDKVDSALNAEAGRCFARNFARIIVPIWKASLEVKEGKRRVAS